MNLEAYLSRIKTNANAPTDLQLLRNLQNNHLESIPFENLDIKRNVPITLNLDRFYEKVVNRNRGGFCYELNGLFKVLLDHLGYKTKYISCTVLKPDGTWTIPDSHAAIIVDLDVPYLVDVGFGDSARNPLPLTGEEKTDVSGTYKVFSKTDGAYDLMLLEKEKWVTKYRFFNEEKKLDDFEFGCHFHQTSPKSIFTQGDIITIATPTGRIFDDGHFSNLYKKR